MNRKFSNIVQNYQNKQIEKFYLNFQVFYQFQPTNWHFPSEIKKFLYNNQSKNFLFRQFNQKSINASKQLQFQLQQKFILNNSQNINKKPPSFRKKWQYEIQNFLILQDEIVQQQSSHQPLNENHKKPSSVQMKMSNRNHNLQKRAYNSQSGAFKYIQVDQKNFIQTKHDDIKRYYEFIQLIGKGAFGNVYKARCLITKQLRAIKILKSFRCSQKKNEQKFLAELDILKTLDHQNIIKLYQVYYFQSFYYVVTQYCSGGSISDYLMKYKKRLPHQIIKKIMKQLLSALNYMHDQKIVHRDLKLQNIVFQNFINQQTSLQEINIKIIDFGLSKKLKFFCQNKDLKCIGTPKYLAPETKKGLYSDKCDIWSAGIIFNYLLTGKFLIQQTFDAQTMQYHQVHQQIDFKKHFWATVHPEAKILLRKMLIKDDLSRVSAKQAIKSLWFYNQTSVGKTQRELILKKLSDYDRENNLICLVESYIIYLKANKQDRLKASNFFNKIDKDQNGCIDKNQLLQFFPDLKFSEDVILKEFMQKLDKNKSGKIQFSQFMACLYDRQKLFNYQYLGEAFDYLDRNHDGYIARSQLQNALKGCELNQFQLIMQQIDMDKDDKISRQEFLTYMTMFFPNDQD